MKTKSPSNEDLKVVDDAVRGTPFLNLSPSKLSNQDKHFNEQVLLPKKIILNKDNSSNEGIAANGGGMNLRHQLKKRLHEINRQNAKEKEEEIIQPKTVKNRDS